MKRTAILAIFVSIPLFLALQGEYLAIHQALVAGSPRGVTDAAGIITIETNTLLEKSGARLGKPPLPPRVPPCGKPVEPAVIEKRFQK
ncbi:MAG: hypothetical protein D6812_13470 [Deltaproteobacteria bacterium]|nr:MAG: hypothetical protein D6812_13470 [Deltaproteobacteria bacterium]